MKRVIILFVVGCAALLGALATQHWGAALVAPLQVAASDLLFARSDGPRLGRRPARDDIVLVLFDQKTASTMGYEHHYTDDVVLYRTLLKAGARVVFDTRMVATASSAEFQNIKPMLEEMLEINNQGGLMRDVWLSSAILTETHPRYANLIAQNVVNSHPHAIPWVRPRLYPLVYFTGLGPHESAPLTIARRVWGLERPSPEVVACAVQTVLDGRTMVEPPTLWSAAVAALVIIGMAFAAGLLRPVSGVLAAAGILLAAQSERRSRFSSDSKGMPQGYR